MASNGLLFVTTSGSINRYKYFIIISYFTFYVRDTVQNFV